MKAKTVFKIYNALNHEEQMKFCKLIEANTQNKSAFVVFGPEIKSIFANFPFIISGLCKPNET